MKGQASIEAIFILAAVLLIASGFVIQGQQSGNPVNAASAAKTGAENAINNLEMKHDVEITISEVDLTDDEINIKINFWGGELSEASIEENIRTDSLKYVYQAFKGDFPKDPNPVSTSHHNFTVTVEAERVKK